MNENEDKIPPKLQEIISDFQISEGREKLELLLDYSERMPDLPDWLRGKQDQMDQVQECMTPVFVEAKVDHERMSFYFDVPPESPTVRGYAALLAEGLEGSTPAEVLGVPADFYRKMGLEGVLTQQRLNGISAILVHMKRLAVEALAK
jgi:cysteine desulfuration protein SufE